ncbi:MAG: SPOR domain-containing protein [Bacteroidales bacterium]|nr:SPOR domain-containing protein [Bacteroidales bacterium]
MNVQFVSKLFLISFFFQVLFVSAQQPTTRTQNQSNESILEELNRHRPAQGNVMVYQDEAIVGILAKPNPTALPVYTSEDGVTQYVKMSGYKIQVFSGNDQRKSKDEAYSKQNLINDRFEELETVVYFTSPRWILRAGNFRTREEADVMMKQITKQFPAFGKEMYIVSDTVKIPY